MAKTLQVPCFLVAVNCDRRTPKISNKQIDYFLKNHEQFVKVRMRLLNILLMSNTPLTAEQIKQQYFSAYGHMPRIENRLRELRAEGEAESVFDEDLKRNLWTVSDKWTKPKAVARGK